MAAVQTILKKTRQQAVAKIVGDGQANVTYLDLKLSDETIDLGNLSYTITGMLWSATDSVSAPIIIRRNNSNVLFLHGNDNWSLSQMFGFVDSSNSNANINVTLPSGGGTLYLHMSKPSGFIEPDQQTKK